MAASTAALVLVGCNQGTPTSPQTANSDSSASPSSASPSSASPSASISTNAPAAAGSQEWTTTPSGLKYQVLKKGTGTVSPKPTDTVKVHYQGTLLDGTVFDSSIQRGEPISFPLNAVIPGWTEGLQLMKVGDKFKFQIPPNLAYGAESPPGSKIPPNSTLVFEVELLGIQ